MSNDVWTEIRFWSQITTDSERTVICSPDLESRVKGWVDARNLAGVIKVQATPVCPAGTIWIMDHNAIEADTREALSRPMPLFETPQLPSLAWREAYPLGFGSTRRFNLGPC